MQKTAIVVLWVLVTLGGFALAQQFRNENQQYTPAPVQPKQAENPWYTLLPSGAKTYCANPAAKEYYICKDYSIGSPSRYCLESVTYDCVEVRKLK